MMKSRIRFSLPLLLLLTACHQKEAPRPMVDRLEGAGAGDLSTASIHSIQQWLQQHEDLALEVKKECERVRKSGNATANWGRYHRRQSLYGGG